MPAGDSAQDHGPGDVTYGPAAQGDFVAIAALDAIAWNGGSFPMRIPDGEHVWRIWVDYAHVLVARVDARAGAFRGHERRSGERGQGDAQSVVVGGIVAFPTNEGELFVHKLMVAEAYRRRGIGTRLFELLLTQVDGQVGAPCLLTVDPAHVDAIRRYETLGFTEKQLIAGFYRSDEDRCVMRRPATRR